MGPWDFPGKNTGVGSHFLLQRLFPTQESNPCLLHWQEDYLPLSQQGSWKGFQIPLKHWFLTSSNSAGETCSSYLETHWLLRFGAGEF